VSLIERYNVSFRQVSTKGGSEYISTLIKVSLPHLSTTPNFEGDKQWDDHVIQDPGQREN
jgi:hypothetical protein